MLREAYDAGAPISSLGYHAITVSAVDDSENSVREVVFFEIRRRRQHNGTLYVSDIQTAVILPKNWARG